jgi:dolichol-phosphate mannosyltransferase
MKTVVVIIPTFNESGNIESLIQKVQEITGKIKGYAWKILVVDDYSPDGTADIVKKLAKKHKNITLVSKEKEGLGAAYVFGMNYALKHLSPDIFVQMDADWQHDPTLLPEFIKEIETGADFVVGSRYIQGGSIPQNWGLNRKIYSITGNLIVRFGLGMKMPHDWTSGYRMMRSEVYTAVSAGLEKFSGYTFQVAFLHRVAQAHFKISEVPLRFVDRLKGRSKIAPYDYIKNVILYVVNNSTLIKYVAVGVVGFSIQTIIFESLNHVGVFPGVSVVVGSFFAIIANFLGNNLWTFKHNKIEGFQKLLVKFGHFLLTSIGAVIIQGIVVSLAVSWFGHAVRLWAMIGAIVFLVIPYNYFIYNKFIWKTHKKAKS